MERDNHTAKRVLAIVPAFNEAESIEATMLDLAANAPFVDVVVVDDGSRDNTAKICRSHSWKLIPLPVNLGLSDAFQAGMRYAFANDYDFAIQFDADGQHCAEYIKPMLETAIQNGSEIVIGSRFVTAKKNASARMLGSSIISILLKMTTGKWINDPTSGMRLYNRKVIKEFATKYDYGPEPDTLALLLRKGLKITEMQVSMRERVAGESYLSLHKSSAYMMRMFISILLVQWVRE